MNVGEEAGKTARGAIEALKGTPMILALVLLQALVLGMLAWYSHERTKSNEHLIALFERQFQHLIQRCDGK